MNERLGPTRQADRIITLDIIRGFALLGILLVNMHFFSTPKLFLTVTEVRLFDDPLSEAASWLIAIFAQNKFFTTFSFLFGLGFYLFMERVEAKKLSVPKLYSRRLFFLLMVGIIHVFFLWSGDILLPYAIAGFFLLLFRKKTEEAVKKWAISLFSGVLIVLGGLTYLGSVVENVLDSESFKSVYLPLIDDALVVFQTGDFLDILAFRVREEVPLVLGNLFFMVPLVLSIFLFGLYVGKIGVLKNIQEHLSWIRQVWKKSFLYGLVLTIVFLILKGELIILPFYLHAAVVEVLALVTGLVVCFFYVTSITLLCQCPKALQRLRVIAPVGQMALTNYLLQTLICIFIFNGFGFGLYGKVAPFLWIPLPVGIFILQVVISHLWLKNFRYGPVERLWRAFTYKGLEAKS